MPPTTSLRPDIFGAPRTAGGEQAAKAPTWGRAALLQGGLIVFAVALIGRAAEVQLLQRGEWRARAQAQQLAATPLPAPRGRILDVNGAVLVESRQLVKLSVAPREVVADIRRSGDGLARMDALVHALARVGVSQEWLARVRDTTRAWVDVPGRFLATDVQSVTNLRGVHPEPALERVPPSSDGLRRLIGRADDAGGAVDGLEKALDGVLRGAGGRESLVRDVRGQRIKSPEVAESAPVTGHTVVLSINTALQDIAERALGDAVASMHANGGDIVMLDPATGEVRAMASRRSDKLSTVATALTEPYEPGSTLKPFYAARLLDLGRARAGEIVNTHNGKWELNGRKIEDDHPSPQFSLADVIKYSSNIGIVQFAARFSPSEQFELLRDLGFGTQTGIAYSAEAQGLLPAPRHWDSMTAASLAMGYALNVTPLQLAIAYGAIANGGELLEPAIVDEIRTADGRVMWKHQRRIVRRVMSAESAGALRGMLRGVVEAGTAEGSNLSTYDVAGKTGTAKVAIGGRYVPGRYTASFVGMFPAENPQLVILVKLDSPTKSIYGGKAAAPVSKVVLQAALAARDAALDRAALAGTPSHVRSEPADSAARAMASRAAPHTAPTMQIARVAAAATPVVPPDTEPVGAVAWVARIDEPHGPAPVVVTRRAVPNVHGMPVRRAVYELHRAGFRASVPGGGMGADRALATSPAAGTLLTTGSVVVLGREP